MKIWKPCTAAILVIALASCQSTARMTPLDRALVKKTVTPTQGGGVKIEMAGDFIFNPTAAVETFHTVAEKHLGGRPYRYSYTINRGPVKPRQGQAAADPQSAPVTGRRSATVQRGPGYIPIYTGVPGSSGGSTEAAIVFGSLALLMLLAQMAKDHGGGVAEVEPAHRVLQVVGMAEPIAPVQLDRGRVVEVVIPDTPPQIGRLSAQVARGVAEAVRDAFTATGSRAVVNNWPGAGGYVARTTVLRAQGNLIQYSDLTVEVSLHDQRTGRELTRMVVQAREKPFDLKAQSERQNQGGIAPSILTKPLQAKIRRYLQ